jgi:autotransporter-associated beta strand protein
VIITRNGSGVPIQFGALGGTSGSSVGPGNSSSSGNSYSVGGNNANATFAGQLKADGVNTFTKIGSGVWTLTGANSYSGGTVINSGVILANNTSGSATGSGAVTVNTSGALGGTGSVSGAVTVNSGGAIAPGSNGVGTVTFTGGLTLNSGAILNFDLGPTGASDKIAITGAVVLNGVLYITNVAGFGAGTYTLMTYSGALSGTLPTIDSKPSGYSCMVNTNTAGQVRLVVQVQTSPVFDSIAVAGTNIMFSGSGGPTNVPYYVLTSTNIASSLSNWTRIATNQFNGGGGFIFTHVINTNAPQAFYLLQLP